MLAAISEESFPELIRYESALLDAINEGRKLTLQERPAAALHAARLEAKGDPRVKITGSKHIPSGGSYTICMLYVLCQPCALLTLQTEMRTLFRRYFTR